MGGIQPTPPKPDYTGSIEPSQEGTFSVHPSWPPLSLCYSRHQNWWCLRLGFSLVGCSVSQPWSSKARSWLQRGSVHTVKVKFILKISAGLGLEFSQLQSQTFSEKTRAVNFMEYVPNGLMKEQQYSLHLPLVFCYTYYIISVDAPDFAFPPYHFPMLFFILSQKGHPEVNESNCESFVLEQILWDWIDTSSSFRNVHRSSALSDHLWFTGM